MWYHLLETGVELVLHRTNGAPLPKAIAVRLGKLTKTVLASLIAIREIVEQHAFGEAEIETDAAEAPTQH